MRVITGTARGRVLRTLEGEDVRPTTDRVKEAVFSIIQFEIEGRRVLDLFAGTGALSLESVSRGAKSAVLVDTDRDACAAIRKNIEVTRMGESCRLLQKDYRAAMDQLAREGCAFDVVFLDPPYRMENTGEICAALYDRGLLAEAFLLVVEHRRGCAPLLDARFEAFDQRSYGDTQITFARRAAAQEDNSEDGTVPGEL